jgi:RNA polymerase sigma factor (TIGR02999 family)
MRPAALRGPKASTAQPSMVPDSPRSISQLLDAWSRGERAALDALVPEVYAMLHQQARRALRDQPDGHTLQPTALVNEAYFRLASQPGVGSESRSHFLAVAAMVMRSVLVDHARARQRAKRGGNAKALSLGAADEVAASEDPVDVVALDDALTRLAAQDERKARVVELRYFVGLSIEETAKALDSSPATVKREWTTARAWLRRELMSA